MIRQLSVVIPAYNEQERIFSCIRRAATEARQHARSVQLLVVDDGSADATTARSVQAALAVPRGVSVTCLRVNENKGKGHALRYGIGHTTGDVVVLLDGDLDIDPEELGSLVQCIVDQGASLVIANRRAPQSRVFSPLHRRILSWGYRTCVSSLIRLDISDTQCGLKAADGDLLRVLARHTRVNRFAWDVELLALAQDLKIMIRELPITVRTRPKPGRMSWSDIWATLIDTIRIAANRSAAAVCVMESSGGVIREAGKI